MRILDKLFSGSAKATTPAVARTVEQLQLAAKLEQGLKQKRSLLIELSQKTESLTKKDIATWRRAWQMAINYENPSRAQLLDVYTDSLIDLHLSGCIGQRKGKTTQKAFIFTDKNGKENDQARTIFEREWFLSFLDMVLDSRYYGHSLIQLGNVLKGDGTMYFDNVELVPRKHVIPEYGRLVKEVGGEWRSGIPYREGDIASWCVEIGNPHDLGLLLKCSPQALSKKNMLAYWDMFGEMFGMPIRIGKTTSSDEKDIAKIEDMLAGMGAAAYGLFPEGTEIEIKETTRGDAYNVYDKRVERCNSEVSKGILNQTMTIDNGSSLSQSEVHLEVFENVCRADAMLVKYIINGALIPKMVKLGFPLQGVTFDWDEAVNYTPAEQREMERMLIQYYNIDPAYFVDKYKIPITGARESASNFFD